MHHRQVFDAKGCSVCGSHHSTSFRNEPKTGRRLCNSCHCQAYRQKRKAAALEAAAQAALMGPPAPQPLAPLPSQQQLADLGEPPRTRQRSRKSRTPAPASLDIGGLEPEGMGAGLARTASTASRRLPPAYPPAAQQAAGHHAHLLPPRPPAPHGAAAGDASAAATWLAAAARALASAHAATLAAAGGQGSGLAAALGPPSLGLDRGPSAQSASSLHLLPSMPATLQRLDAPAAPAYLAAAATALQEVAAASAQQAQQAPLPQQQQQQQQQAPLILPLVQPAQQGPQGQDQLAIAAAHLFLSDLQQRVLSESGGSPADLPRLLCCARRAQASTPGRPRRAVLGLLPHVLVRLHDDPPGILHPLSCLVEAVGEPAATQPPAQPPQAAHPAPSGAAAAAAAAGQASAALGAPATGALVASAEPAAAAAPAVSGGSQGEPPAVEQLGSGSVVADTPDGAVAVRMTLFASAGAVAAWHEGPPDPSLPVASDASGAKAPVWECPQGGFTLHFSGPLCPQMDLVAAAHYLVAAVGPAALDNPILALSGEPAAPRQAQQVPAAPPQLAQAAQPAAAQPPAQPLAPPAQPQPAAAASVGAAATGAPPAAAGEGAPAAAAAQPAAPKQERGAAQQGAQQAQLAPQQAQHAPPSPGLLLRALHHASPAELAQLATLLPLLSAAAAPGAAEAPPAAKQAGSSPVSPPDTLPAAAAAPGGSAAAQPPSVAPPPTASPRQGALPGLDPLTDLSKLPAGDLANLLDSLS